MESEVSQDRPLVTDGTSSGGGQALLGSDAGRPDGRLLLILMRWRSGSV